MANYLRPGVYIEESLTPLTQAFGAPGDAVAAFVGTHTKGPTVPTLITSWTQFQSLFGGFSANPAEYLAHAVYQYFNNGGRNAYVVRAANANATAATVTLKDTAATPADLLSVTAKAVGLAGNSVYVSVAKADPDATPGTRFNLYVHDGGSTNDKIVERFFDLSMNPADSRYAPAILNSPLVGSALVSVAHAGSTTYSVDRARPAEQSGTALTTGSDGTGTPALDNAAKLLEEVNQNLVLNLPGVTDSTVLNSVVTWASGLGTVFVVVDGPAASPTTSATVAAYGAVPAALAKSSYAAVYGPWILVDDPATAVRGSVRAMPPGGAVVGRYVATDASRGVQKPPAGVDNALSSVLGLDAKFLSADLDTLNQKGVNVIKPVPGVGFCIFGARTLANGNPDRYVSVRRSLMTIKKALVEGTRWALFEPNDEVLWSRLSGNIEQYLNTLMQTGVLRGATAAEAFFVKCDSENNTAASVAAGEVHIEIGVALQSPAEFIVIKIGQYQGGGTASETV